MTTELIVIDEGKELEYFGIEGADNALVAVKEHLKDFKHNIKTATGRKEIASMASKIGKSRKLLDDLGAKLRKEIQDSKNDRKTAFDEYQAEFRKPLTDWEETEGKRINEIKEAINGVVQMGNRFGPDNEELGSVALIEQMEVLSSFIVSEEVFAEFTAKAIDEKNSAIACLKEVIDKRLQYEADQAELTRLREKEAAEKEDEPDFYCQICGKTVAYEFADNHDCVIRSDTGTSEEDFNEPFHAPLEENTTEVLQDKQGDGIQFKQTIDQLEPVHQAAPISRTAPSDREHKRTINNEILAAVIKCGFTDEQGKNFVAAMVSGDIPHITVNY